MIYYEYVKTTSTILLGFQWIYFQKVNVWILIKGAVGLETTNICFTMEFHIIFEVHSPVTVNRAYVFILFWNVVWKSYANLWPFHVCIKLITCFIEISPPVSSEKLKLCSKQVLSSQQFCYKRCMTVCSKWSNFFTHLLNKYKLSVKSAYTFACGKRRKSCPKPRQYRLTLFSKITLTCSPVYACI